MQLLAGRRVPAEHCVHQSANERRGKNSSIFGLSRPLQVIFSEGGSRALCDPNITPILRVFLVRSLTLYQSIFWTRYPETLGHSKLPLLNLLGWNNWTGIPSFFFIARHTFIFFTPTYSRAAILSLIVFRGTQSRSFSVTMSILWIAVFWIQAFNDFFLYLQRYWI